MVNIPSMSPQTRLQYVLDHAVRTACEDHRVLTWKGEVLGEHGVGNAPSSVRPAIGGDAESIVPLETIAMHGVELVDLLPAEDVLLCFVSIDEPDACVLNSGVVEDSSENL